ncbi:MAG: hypothetical protein JWM31_1653 [Solirubrobacterales bacterium]|nr:hypothetical protein [Solirubrobacterales bacterium]
MSTISTEDDWPQDPEERLVRLVHDLRTPLTIVGGFADLILRRGDALSPEERADYLARLAQGARDMRAILDAEREGRMGPKA